MSHYNIKYSSEAIENIKNLKDTIVNIYKAPLTAVRYIQGLKSTISTLNKMPHAYPINTANSLKKYGSTSRHINYKEMTIIYDIFKTTVYIHCVIPSNTIKGLY